MSALQPDKEYIIDILKNLPLFSELAFPALKELAFVSQEKVFHKSELIFEEGNPGNAMMIIISGEVRITQHATAAASAPAAATGNPTDKPEETLSVLKKGDCFGEMALLENLPRSATVIAHTDAVVLEITRERFMRFIEKDSLSGVRILLALARSLSARLREADIKIKAFVDLARWI